MTAAVAVGWDGAVVEVRRVVACYDGEVLDLRDDHGGRPVRVVTAVDGDAFRTTWLECIEAACRRRP